MKFFKNILKIIAIILIIIAIIYLIAAVMVYMGVASAATISASILGGFGALTFASAWPLLWIALGAIALAFIVDADSAKKALSAAASGVSTVVDKVVGVVAGATGSVIGGIGDAISKSGILGWAALAIGLFVGYKVLTKPKQPEYSDNQRYIQRDTGERNV